MEKNQLNHVAPVFRVVDLGRSISYYQHKLGFDVEFQHGGFYAGLLRDGCHVHLRHAGLQQRDQVEFEADEYVDACFNVQNAFDLASQFAKAGAKFVVPLRDSTYGKEFYVSDPDGHILAFVQAARDSI
ncbi:MAG: VOC family protein [Candidatus Eremiobacteraeota bacterium]|nr:VOC family protein [Candidatus Eremiobacteraeota bacterium]